MPDSSPNDPLEEPRSGGPQPSATPEPPPSASDDPPGRPKRDRERLRQISRALRGQEEEEPAPKEDKELDLKELARIYTSFLDYCRPIPERLMNMLGQWGLDGRCLDRFALRYYFHGYRQAIRELAGRFGLKKMLRAGLLVAGPAPGEQSDSGDGPGTVYTGRFEPYREAGVAYLIVPYLLSGRPVFLKARPLMDAKQLRAKGLPTSLSTANAPPSLFNLDAVHEGDQVVLVRRELDAMAACSLGLLTMAYNSLENFSESWIRSLAGKHVVLVLDAHKPHDEPVKELQAEFERLNGPRPQLILSNEGLGGRKLAEFLIQALQSRPETDPLDEDSAAAIDLDEQALAVTGDELMHPQNQADDLEDYLETAGTDPPDPMTIGAAEPEFYETQSDLNDPGETPSAKREDRNPSQQTPSQTPSEPASEPDAHEDPLGVLGQFDQSSDLLHTAQVEGESELGIDSEDELLPEVDQPLLNQNQPLFHDQEPEAGDSPAGDNPTLTEADAPLIGRTPPEDPTPRLMETDAPALAPPEGPPEPNAGGGLRPFDGPEGPPIPPSPSAGQDHLQLGEDELDDPLLAEAFQNRAREQRQAIKPQGLPNWRNADERFVASLPVRKNQSLVIYRIQHENGPPTIECQYWSTDPGATQAPAAEEFSLPLEWADELIAALEAAKRGEASTQKPDWLGS